MTHQIQKVFVSVCFRGRSIWKLVEAVKEGDHFYVKPEILEQMAASLGAQRGDTYVIG